MARNIWDGIGDRWVERARFQRDPYQLCADQMSESDKPKKWHPIFGRIVDGAPKVPQTATERRVQQAREDGLFDNLSGAGKPIADIDHHRPPGWWADRFVKRERSKLKAIELEEEIRKAMPGLWRLKSEKDVISMARRLNERIDQYNKATTVAPMEQLDIAATVATWRRLKHA